MDGIARRALGSSGAKSDAPVSSPTDWQETFETALDATSPLGAEDLDTLGEAAWWLRQIPDCIAARERAFAAYLDGGRPREAALVGLRLFYPLSVRGDGAIATGWLRRSARLLADLPEGVEHGELKLAEARVARDGDGFDAELARAQEAIAIGRRFHDADLIALGQHIEGRVLVKQGSVPDGMAILDDAMLAAVQGGLGPMATGQVYCNVIAAGQELGDLHRAHRSPRACCAAMASRTSRCSSAESPPGKRHHRNRSRPPRPRRATLDAHARVWGTNPSRSAGRCRVAKPFVGAADLACAPPGVRHMESSTLEESPHARRVRIRNTV